MTWFALYIHSEQTELDQIDLNLYRIAQVDPFFSNVSLNCKTSELVFSEESLRTRMLLKTYTGLLCKKNALESVFNKSLGNSYIEFSLSAKVTLI